MRASTKVDALSLCAYRDKFSEYRIVFAKYWRICERFIVKNNDIIKIIIDTMVEKVYQGGEEMKYEKPEIEVIKLKMLDIITESQIGSESSGSGDNFGGNGEYPWE